MKTILITCIKGIIQEHSGGAIATQTYSNATIDSCHFEENVASDDGGAIYVKRRSFLKVTKSKFVSNRARNSGGSILVQNSQSTIGSCNFENESAVEGFGGAICVENVGNCEIQNCSFIGCKAVSGGTVSLVSESAVNIESSWVSGSHSSITGGGFFVDYQSVLTGTNLTLDNSVSSSGGGLSLSDSSEVKLKKVSISKNTATTSGGAIFCHRSSVTFERGYAESNTAGNHGGAVHLDYCSGTIDNVKFLHNNAHSYGGGIYAQFSALNTHNIIGEGNEANYMSGMAMITFQSMFKSFFMRLKFGDYDSLSNNIAVVNKSEAQIDHLNIELPVEHPVCPLRAFSGSRLVVTSVYYTGDVDIKSDHWIGQLNNDSLESACAENSGKHHLPGHFFYIQLIPALMVLSSKNL